MFFKNTLLVLPQFYFGAFSLFSGQPVYTDMLYQVYNMFLTAFPVIVFGILDQDISYSASFENPEVFKLKEAHFTTKNFWISQGLGFIHAGLIFMVVMMAFGNGIWDQDGKVCVLCVSVADTSFKFCINPPVVCRLAAINVVNAGHRYVWYGHHDQLVCVCQCNNPYMHGDAHMDVDLQLFRVALLGALVGMDDLLIDSPRWLVYTSPNRGVSPDL